MPKRVRDGRKTHSGTDSLRILYYSPHPDLSVDAETGYGTHMRSMIGAFRALRHDVQTVIMGDIGSSSVASSTVLNSARRTRRIVPSTVWQTARDVKLLRFDRNARRTLHGLAREYMPDLIYERANYIQTSGLSVARQIGVPHVLEVNAPYVEERRNLSGHSWLSPLGVQRERQLLSHSNLPVVVSTVLRDHFCKNYKLPRSRFLVLPNAIDPAFARDPDTIVEGAAKLGRQLQGEFVVGFVGSMFRWHGVDLLVRAVGHLAKMQKPVSLLLVGSTGELREELGAIAKECEVESLIHFIGPVPHNHVPSYIDLMDVTVMATSNWYGSPVKIFEYGALGKPIVAPDVAPVRDVMIDGVHGTLVGSTVESIVAGIEHVMMQPEGAELMAREFQLKVLTQHTWAQNAQKVIERLAGTREKDT